MGDDYELLVDPVGAAPSEVTRSAEALLRHPDVAPLVAGTEHRLLLASTVDDDARPRSEDPSRVGLRALVFDYTNSRTLRIDGRLGEDAPAAVAESSLQPPVTGEEFAAAVERVREDARLGAALRDGRIVYRPMPPLVSTRRPDGSTSRLVTVGLHAKDPADAHEIVGVDLADGSVTRFEDHAPAGALARAGMCGAPSAADPTTDRGTPGSARMTVRRGGVELWRFLVVRPAASSGRDGSGVELRDVHYRRHSVLVRAHVPILNVRYEGGVCGPFRDWQWQEGMFVAQGRSLAPGIIECPTPARTMLDTNRDAGTFRGVAVYRAGAELVLVSELEAGWYRYVSEWRLHDDGTIRPRFGFTAVANSCVCHGHHHHVYWRFNFHLGNGARNRVSEFNDPPLVAGGAKEHILKFETRRGRDAARKRRWLVKDKNSGAGYRIVPGPNDGMRDAYGVGDLWALRNRSTQIDDDPTDTRAGIDAFANGEAIDGADIVVWYAAHFRHVQRPGEPHEHGEHIVGPELRPDHWPAP